MQITAATTRLIQRIEPQARVEWSVRLLLISVAAWPITSMTIFRGEQQGILGLSWVAFIVTLLNIVITTDVRQEQDGA